MIVIKSFFDTHPFYFSRYHNFINLFILIFFEIVFLVISCFNPLISLLTILGIIVIVSCIFNTFLGLILIILGFAFQQSTKEINIQEIIFGIILLSTIIGWLFRTILIYGKKIINNTSELYLFLFLIIVVFSIIISLFQNVSLFIWFRKFIPFLIYFLYFPLVENLRSKKELNIILLTLLITISIIGLNSLTDYAASLSSAQKLWQIMASREVYNEPYFYSGLVLLTGMMFFSKKLYFNVIFLIFIPFFVILLAISFSRGYWLAAFISLIIMFYFLPLKKKLLISIILFSILLITIIFSKYYFGNIFDILVSQLDERLFTLGKLARDSSVIERINESKELIKYLKINPFVGFGLGKEYSFLVYSWRTIPTDYVHNAFLSLWFKFGIFGLLVYLIFYISMIIKSHHSFKCLTSNKYKGLYLGIFCVFIGMLPLSISSPQFTQNNSILLIVIFSSIVTSSKGIFRNVELTY